MDVPDIAWLPVAPGGDLTITRHWLPDTPDDEEKFINIGTFSVVPFYIAQYLVTVAQYQAFVEADDGFKNEVWWQAMPTAYQCQPLATQRTMPSNHPQDALSWYQCIAFARWMNHRLDGLELPHPSGIGVFRVGDNAQVRLPTEIEWLWAAQNGVEARRYPWGELQANRCNTVETGLKQTLAVGMYPQGAAACGALDMAGNLMEWGANDKADPTKVDVTSTASKALRGGDWGWGIENAACTYCDDEIPARKDVLNGCRLVVGEIV